MKTGTFWKLSPYALAAQSKARGAHRCQWPTCQCEGPCAADRRITEHFMKSKDTPPAKVFPVKLVIARIHEVMFEADDRKVTARYWREAQKLVDARASTGRPAFISESNMRSAVATSLTECAKALASELHEHLKCALGEDYVPAHWSFKTVHTNSSDGVLFYPQLTISNMERWQVAVLLGMAPPEPTDQPEPV